jgi:uncharacterized protein involved in type VI secretion and phage assembly
VVDITKIAPAGSGLGREELARVGQEVIVEFLNGDFDRPIIPGADLDENDLLLRNPKICESQEAPLAQKRIQGPWTQA